MPWPILAHQAPVLPLRLWKKRAFNGTALVIGSIAPDFEYLLQRGPVGDDFPHSIPGQFLFCLPVTLTIVLLVGFFDLGSTFVARLRGRALWLAGAATDVVREGGTLRAGGSALIGSFSHIAFDEFTHTWLPRALPRGTFHMGGLFVSSVGASQLAISALATVPALWLLHRISRERPADVPAPQAGLSLMALFASAGAALGVLHCVPAIRNPDDYFEAGRLYVWGDVVFQAACGAGVGVLVALMTLAIFDRRAISRLG